MRARFKLLDAAFEGKAVLEKWLAVRRAISFFLRIPPWTARLLR